MPGTNRHCLESELLKCDDPTPSNVVNSMLLAMWRATPCSSRYEHDFISILCTFNLPSSNKVPWSGSLTRLHCIRNCKTIALSMKDARRNLQRLGHFFEFRLVMIIRNDSSKLIICEFQVRCGLAWPM